MKCHYEILGVNRDADNNVIKKAYRKLALQWHPDKNMDNPNAAREQFQLVQQAYEVLSDSSERSWYDNHREQILRGKNSDYEDNCLDVFQYFTVTCFKGYGDDVGGFYQVYGEVFEKISTEDSEFIKDEDEIFDIPKFGTAESNYEDIVGPFYAYWQSYCTKKSYAWLCKYDITEIKDRRVLREIEKDTKKLAQKAKKERNEEVRNLVSFVRKRDKRVQAYRKQLEDKAEQNRKKQEQNRLDQIRKRNREVEEMQKSHAAIALKPDGYEEQIRLLEQEYSDCDDESVDNQEEEFDDNDDTNNLCDETQYYDELYCVACNKAFKNENAFINHEISQKHLTNVEKLKIKIKSEENQYVIDNDETPDNDCDISIEDDHELETQINNELENKSQVKKTKKKKFKKTQNTKIESDDDNEHFQVNNLLVDLNVDDDNDDWQDSSKRSVKKSKNKKINHQQQQTKKSDVEQVLKGEVNPSATNENMLLNKDECTNELPRKDLNHVCVTCNSTFESKNKLFTHLKKTNHGVYIPKQVNDIRPTINSTRKGKKK